MSREAARRSARRMPPSLIYCLFLLADGHRTLVTAHRTVSSEVLKE